MLREAIYEPRLLDSDKNPEARLINADNTILDIEIKTPDFPERNIIGNFATPACLLNDAGRK